MFFDFTLPPCGCLNGSVKRILDSSEINAETQEPTSTVPAEPSRTGPAYTPPEAPAIEREYPTLGYE